MKKDEEIQTVRIRPMSKSEVAMTYAPALTPQAAVNRLMQWISINPALKDALSATGYHKHQKVFTIRQVQLIFEHLGEP